MLEFYYSSTCPECEKKIPIVEEIEREYMENVTVVWKDISVSEKYWEEWDNHGFYDIPSIVINNETKIPVENITLDYVRTTIDAYIAGEKLDGTEGQSAIVELPFFGRINTSQLSLPVLTVTLGALDSFNPCAFFVLLFLLNILIYAQSRKRMALIGGIFIFFSGFIYFIFMSALLNIFVITAHITVITAIAGVIALVIGSLNIKDFFFFKKGISASIPESKKPKLFKKMRKLVKATSASAMIVGVIVLAISANTYELFCTLAFPMIFTRALTLHNLPIMQYYLYLVFYNVVYVIPLLVVVAIFVVTLGRRKLTQWQGQVLKLTSGLMMLSLGLVFVFAPDILHNVLGAIGILMAALAASAIVIFVWKKIHLKKEKNII